MEYVALFMILLGLHQVVKKAQNSEAAATGQSLFFGWLKKKI